MLQSKISTVRSMNWGDFSSLQTSNAPGFVPISCPTHTEYAITNICRASTCIQPLCPECITVHVQLHEENKKPAKIENIITTRLACIEKLAQLKYETKQQVQKYEKLAVGNIDEFIKSNQNKIKVAKKKIMKMIDQYFTQLDKKMQIMSNEYLNQKQKKNNQMNLKLIPLTDYLSRITQYKLQLQSNDFIPALIEFLNDPPHQPIQISKPSFENYGEISINQRSLQNMKNNLHEFISLELHNCSTNSNRNLNISRSNYHSSNNMKFSRMDRSRSNDSRKSVNSRSKIFRDKVDSVTITESKDNFFLLNNSNLPSRNSLEPPTQTASSSIQSPYNVVKQSSIQHRVNIGMGNYFSNPQSSIIYFEPNTYYYYRGNINYLSSGFDRIQLPNNMKVPNGSNSIVIPSGEAYLIGGQIDGKISNSVHNIDLYSAKALQPMKQARSYFAICYHYGNIYVFGGLNSNRQPIRQCQKYDIRDGTWMSIKPMKQITFNFTVCAFNDVILKFGGMLPLNKKYNKIDIYHSTVNQWSSIDVNLPKLLFSNMGCIQISGLQILIFGGMDEYGKLNSCCSILQDKSGYLELYPTHELYNAATFNQTFIHQGGVITVQNGQKNNHKIIMLLKNGKWKFVSC